MASGETHRPAADTEEITAKPPAEGSVASATTGFRQSLNRGPQARVWRITSMVLLILGCMLAPLAVGASWARNLVVDQDAYLDAVGPLVEDPVILQAAEAGDTRCAR